MRKQTTITIKVTGNNDNINQLLAIASTLNIECETIDAGAVASEENKASKPVASATPKKGASANLKSLDSNQQAVVSKYQQAGCIGYLIDGKTIKAVASYDDKNKGYRFAKVSRGKVVTTSTGAIDTIFDKKKYDNARKAYLDAQHAIHKKCPKGWKLKIYRDLGFYLTSAQEKTMVIF